MITVEVTHSEPDDHYYVVRWKHPEKGWLKSAEWKGVLTLDAAREQLKKDIAYFYDDIPIQLVSVRETVLEEHHGGGGSR